MTLASELSLPDVLQRIAELAAEVTSAKYAALGVVGPDGGILEFVTVGVTGEQRAHIGDLPVGRGVLGKLITEARTIRIPDISKDPASVGFPPNHPPMHSFLGAPVKAGGRVFGNIYLTEKQGAPEFTEEDERAVEVLAAQTGVAIENATARRELERLALMEDRERIAKELHDGVIEIDDDGSGFGPTTVGRSGQGLGNLRERAESLGGGIDLQSAAGNGTTVRLTIPL